MNEKHEYQIQYIPIKQIRILNPRPRGKQKVAPIAANINRLGLKKPIIVARAEPCDGELSYYLGCGEARVEAYSALGEEMIPAIVINATVEELLLMTMAESVPRRKITAAELVRDIRRRKNQGNGISKIPRRIDLESTDVQGTVPLPATVEVNLRQAAEEGNSR